MELHHQAATPRPGTASESVAVILRDVLSLFVLNATDVVIAASRDASEDPMRSADRAVLRTGERESLAQKSPLPQSKSGFRRASPAPSGSNGALGILHVGLRRAGSRPLLLISTPRNPLIPSRPDYGAKILISAPPATSARRGFRSFSVYTFISIACLT